MFFLIIWILYFVVSTRCSIVFDKANQNGIHIRDYCPKMEHCPEGTHVLCMYYDPKHIMGSRCDRGQNLTMTEQLKTMTLDYINEIRIKAAKGNEVGKDGQLLPRGYGMFRLEWDKELATFAQVWANQCTWNHDLCRATKQFPKPGQVVGLIRFGYPDWQYTGAPPPDAPNEKRLSEYKLKYAIERTIMNSYNKKDLVTREMILNFPNMAAHKELNSARIYLTMIHGFSTHVGCGLSSFITYHGDDVKSVIYNAVEVVCNFSAEPAEGKPVYEADPPQKEGWTIACGCPPGYDEDNDCMCIKSERTLPTTRRTTESRPRTSEKQACDIHDPGCEPSLVLLPIFTVEDAPPEKLYHPSGLGNVSGRRDDSFEIFNIVHPKANHLFTAKRIVQNAQSVSVIASPLQLNRRISKMDNGRFKDVRNRYFNKNVVIPEQRYQNGGSVDRRSGHVPQNRIPYTKKNSIFTRATKFQLPGQNNIHGAFLNTTIKKKLNSIKKDVIPRKDFSKVQGLMSAYLNKKHGDISKKPTVTTKYDEHVEHLIASVVPKQQKFGIKDFNNTAPYRKFDIKNSNEETDTKLLSLLDNLEQEVKHIELNSDVKEIVDAKIRKIYGNVVGDPEKLLKAQPVEVMDELLDKLEKKTNLPDDHRVIDTQAHNFESGRPLKRSQNSIGQYDKPSYERYRSKYTIFDKDDRDISYGSDTGKNDIQRDVKNGNSLKQNHYYNENDDGHTKYKNTDKVKMRNYYLNDEDDPLGAERRKYYQDKLDKLERRLQTARGYRRRNEIKQDNSRLVRPVLNARKDLEQTRPVNQAQGFYLPDRAKFLHGF